MTIFILRPSRSRARIGLFDRRGVLPIGDEAIPHIRRELSGLSLIPVDLPLVLPIRDCVAEAYLCLCNEFRLHPLGDSQRPMPLLRKTFKPRDLNVIWCLAPVRVCPVVVTLNRRRNAPANTAVSPKPEKKQFNRYKIKIN